MKNIYIMKFMLQKISILKFTTANEVELNFESNNFFVYFCIPEFIQYDHANDVLTHTCTCNFHFEAKLNFLLE